jgi:hypothetical protein
VVWLLPQGAIRFVLSGANIMCPGLTSPGGNLSDAPEHAPVVGGARPCFKWMAHSKSSCNIHVLILIVIFQ